MRRGARGMGIQACAVDRVALLDRGHYRPPRRTGSGTFVKRAVRVWGCEECFGHDKWTVLARQALSRGCGRGLRGIGGVRHACTEVVRTEASMRAEALQASCVRPLQGRCVLRRRDPWALPTGISFQPFRLKSCKAARTIEMNTSKPRSQRVPSPAHFTGPALPPRSRSGLVRRDRVRENASL